MSVQTYRAVEHVWADGILAGCATVVYHVNSAGAEAAGDKATGVEAAGGLGRGSQGRRGQGREG